MNSCREDEYDILTVICFDGELICCSISDTFVASLRTLMEGLKKKFGLLMVLTQIF